MEKSSDLFGQILTHGPSQSTLFLILTKMKEEGRFREVIQECNKALNFYPDDLRLRILLAESYLEMGSIGFAESELAKVTSHLQDLISVYKLQAEIYIQQQRDEEALDALNQYLALNPDDQSALDLLGKLEPALEEALSDVSQIDAGFAEVEGEKVEDKPKPEATEILEDIAQIREEEVEEKPPLRAAQVTEDVVGTTREIEQDQVLEDEEIPQALERAAQEIIEEEPIPESPEISEDIKQASEEGFDQPSASEFSELPESADNVTPKEDGFTEVATPELAEVYSHQGQIDEAISTYVKVLSANPEDETLKRRLAELRALKAERTEHQPISEDVLRAKKQKMITVMEDWLARIQKLATFPLY